MEKSKVEEESQGNKKDELVQENENANTDEASADKVERRGATGGLAVRTGMKGKPKPLYFWTTSDVNKSLKKHGGELYDLYGELLNYHEVTGRTLIRMTDIKLEKIGITDTSHRYLLIYSKP